MEAHVRNFFEPGIGFITSTYLLPRIHQRKIVKPCAGEDSPPPPRCPYSQKYTRKIGLTLFAACPDRSRSTTTLIYLVFFASDVRFRAWFCGGGETSNPKHRKLRHFFTTLFFRVCMNWAQLHEQKKQAFCRPILVVKQLTWQHLRLGFNLAKCVAQ